MRGSSVAEAEFPRRSCESRGRWRALLGPVLGLGGPDSGEGVLRPGAAWASGQMPGHRGRGLYPRGLVLGPGVRPGSGGRPSTQRGVRAAGKKASPVLTRRLPAAPLPPPYHLQEVEIPVVGNEECNRHYQNASESSDQVIKADMLCAGSEGRDSCQVRLPAALASSSVPFPPVPRPWGRGEPGLRALSPRSWTPGAPWCAAGTAPGSRWGS